MPVTSVESDTLDSIYLGCSDIKNWLRMLGKVADLIDADAMVCFHDIEVPDPERVLTLSDEALTDEAIYGEIMGRAAQATPVEGLSESCSRLDLADGQARSTVWRS